MTKKILALVGAGAMILSVAGSAFAWRRSGSSDVANVINIASAGSYTGENTQNALNSGRPWSSTMANGSRRISTGNAGSSATAVTVANTHVGCGTCSSGGRNHRDVANVENVADAISDTGLNAQDAAAVAGGDVYAGGSRGIRTGSAWSRASAFTIVNTHLGR